MPKDSPDKKPNDKILQRARRRLTQVTLAEEDDRKRSLEDDQFEAGIGHWPDEIKQQRKDETRPCLTLNKIPQFVRQVVGNMRQNKPSIKIRPAEGTRSVSKMQNITGSRDYDTAEVFTGLISNIQYLSSANIAYSWGYRQAVSGGWGYWRVITQYSDDDGFDQDIRIKRIKNRYSVYLDPDSNCPAGSDANWGFISAFMEKQDFIDKHPNASLSELDQATGESYEHWYKDDKVRVAEYYERVPVKKTLLLMSDYSVHEETEDTKKILDELAQQGINVLKRRTVNSYKVMWQKINAHNVLEGPTEVPCQFIPIVRVTGEELIVDGETIRQGVIRQSKDAQRGYNFWRTAETESVALQPKAPWLVPDKVVEGYENIWKNANNKNYSYLPYKAIPGMPRPERSTPPLMSQGMAQQSLMFNDDIKSTMGMYDDSIGKENNDKSGKAILARQSQADTGNYHFIDNLLLAVQHTGRIIVDMIPKVYDSTRMVRLRFPDETEDFVEINKVITDQQTGKEVTIHDLSVGKYDVVVDIGPAYATQRAEAVDALMEFIRAVPKVGEIGADLIAKNMDTPEADELMKRLRKTMPPGVIEYGEDEEPPEIPPTPEQQVKMAQAEADMKLAEAKIAEAEARRAEAESKIAESQVVGNVNEERIKEYVSQALAEFIEQMQAA